MIQTGPGTEPLVTALHEKLGERNANPLVVGRPGRASRLGELGTGVNRQVDQFTDNTLFDEKMGDTVHLALGRAYEDNVPENSPVERNESSIHLDTIGDTSENSRIEVDGEVVQRDGTFRFEDGFVE